jgi:hypothetical protein
VSEKNITYFLPIPTVKISENLHFISPLLTAPLQGLCAPAGVRW